MEYEREQNQTKDPVCGMIIDKDESEVTSNVAGNTIYFCSPECRDEYEKDPQLYKIQAA